MLSRRELHQQPRPQQGNNSPPAHVLGAGRRQDPEDGEDRREITRAPAGIALEEGERADEQDEHADGCRERQAV